MAGVDFRDADAGDFARIMALNHREERQTSQLDPDRLAWLHGLASQHPQVCKFDLAYMEAVSGRRVHHMECIVRGGQVCRFKLGPEPARPGGGVERIDQPVP